MAADPSRIKVLSTLALMGVLEPRLAECERAAGMAVSIEGGPTNAIIDRIRNGEAADIVIVTADAARMLEAEGRAIPGNQVDIGSTAVGLAVRAGQDRPDIRTVDAFRQTLLSARSIAYSGLGASGVFFAGLIERLGIAAAVRAKAIVLPTGLTGAVVARGEAELAVQQISELMQVPGLEIVGAFPPEIQSVTTFTATILSGSADPEAARRLIAFLASPMLRPAMEAAGIRPAV